MVKDEPQQFFECAPQAHLMDERHHSEYEGQRKAGENKDIHANGSCQDS
ncbi:MAG: hypothetical protein SGJ20_17000 [Planctomycetota bacterium]|nr:hypothetical protein [Planctomycetota bacterium]